MAQTPEGKVKADLDKMIKSVGLTRDAPQAGPYGRSGVSDRIIVVCGLYVAVEAKPNAKVPLTALQEKNRVRCIAEGAPWFRVHDAATIEVLRQFILAVKAAAPRGTLVPEGIPPTNFVAVP